MKPETTTKIHQAAGMAARGYTAADIAACMQTSPRTVEHWFKRLCNIHGAKNKVHLIAIMIKKNII